MNGNKEDVFFSYKGIYKLYNSPDMKSKVFEFYASEANILKYVAIDARNIKSIYLEKEELYGIFDLENPSAIYTMTEEELTSFSAFVSLLTNINISEERVFEKNI